MNSMTAIGARLRTQDNLATAEPLFVVQQRCRLYGIDGSYTSDHAWVGEDCQEADEEQAAAFDRLSKIGDPPKGWTRVGYLDRWEFVTACFTRVGAEEYIALNGHNLKEPRVYVDSGYRNYEWIAVRAFLKGCK